MVPGGESVSQWLPDQTFAGRLSSRISNSTFRNALLFVKVLLVAPTSARIPSRLFLSVALFSMRLFVLDACSRIPSIPLSDTLLPEKSERLTDPIVAVPMATMPLAAEWLIELAMTFRPTFAAANIGKKLFWLKLIPLPTPPATTLLLIASPLLAPPTLIAP